MNDMERELWIDNDEGLYNWYISWLGQGKGHGSSKREFIRSHRRDIDSAIENMTSGRKRQHYLAYPDAGGD